MTEEKCRVKKDIGTSNILMIPLPQLQQKILKVFEDGELGNVSIDDLEEYEEIKKLNIDTEWLRRQVKWLVSKSFLTKSTEKRIDASGRTISKPVHIFSYNQIQKLVVPKWEEISSFTLNSKNSKNSSISSDSRVNEVNEVNSQERDKLEVVKLGLSSKSIEEVKEKCPKCKGKMVHDNFAKCWDMKTKHLKACYQCIECEYKVLFNMMTAKFDKEPFAKLEQSETEVKK